MSVFNKYWCDRLDMETFAGWIQQLQQRWNSWIEPDTSVIDPDVRVKARFLASLYLVTALVIGILLVGRYVVVADDRENWQRILVSLGAAALILGIYRLAKQGRVVLSMYATIGATFLIVLGLGLVANSQLGALSTLYYCFFAILFASHFMTLWDTFRLSALFIVVVLLTPQFMPAVTPYEILRGPFAFLSSGTLIALLFMRFRKSIDEAHQRRNLESEIRYRLASDLIPHYAFSFAIDALGTAKAEWVTDGFEQITGYRWGEIGSTDTSRLYHPEDVDRLPDEFVEIKANKRTSGEYRIVTKGGDTRWMHVVRQPVWDAQAGRVVRYYGLAQDITHRKDSELARLEYTLQQERLKLANDFVLAFSHDFRTSLATIETSRFLADRMLQNEELPAIPPRLEGIRRAVSHMSEQLDNLHAITALTAMKREPCDLAMLLNQLVITYAESAREQEIQLLMNVAADLPMIDADGDELKRALNQILQNALSYTPDGGTITLRARQEQEIVVIQIQDTGVGIDSEHLTQIFDFFYRGDAARSVNSGGVGLGLSIARMIIEAHGGIIQAQAVPSGGSCFQIILPIRHFSPIPI
jgi:PAS domain S-box-containing protein